LQDANDAALLESLASQIDGATQREAALAAAMTEIAAARRASQ
jgi:hypothetical protein